MRLAWLVGFAVTLGSSAHALTPTEIATWRDALVHTELVPSECAALLAESLLVGLDPHPPGVELSRSPTWVGADPRERLAKSGGIPFIDMRGRLVRAAATVDADGFWAPRDQDHLQFNRGYARLDLGARTLLVIDHTTSPITAATTLWEDTGRTMVRRAYMPGEIRRVEDRGDQILLHLSDPLVASAVSWDKAKGELVGQCLIGIEAAGIVDGPERILASTPRPFTLARRQTLRYTPPLEGQHEDPQDLREIVRLAPRVRGVVVFSRADGWSLVLVTARDKSAVAAMFGTLPRRIWHMGWLPPGATGVAGAP